RRMLQEALELEETFPDKSFATWLKCVIAENELMLGQHARAIELLLGSLEVFKRMSWPECIAFVLVRLAWANLLSGDAPLCLAQLEEAETADPHNEEPDHVALTRLLEGHARATLGQWVRAQGCYKASMEARVRMGADASEMRAGLADVALATGDLE